MSLVDRVDWFSDPEVHQDPYPYYEELRAHGPAVRLPHHNVVAVTSYDEVVRISFREADLFSSAVAVTGPFPPLPFVPQGEDITPQIEAHRADFASNALVVTMDRPIHQQHRSLLMGVITPRRLKENEEFIVRLSDKQIETFARKGSFEVVKELSHPLATLVTADLLGLPAGEHARLLELLPATTSRIGGRQKITYNPLEAIDETLSTYIEDRRTSPRRDVLTNLAEARFPDGTLPDAIDVARLGSFLFAAGQDTTVRLIASSLRLLGENLELQHLLRENRTKIPAFIEEVLRFESPSKCTFRLARVHTRVGDLEIEPGTIVMTMLGAANRDPARFQNPNVFDIDRPNALEHLAFARGPHACAGAPLARAEARIALNRLFDKVGEIRIDEEVHGAAGARHYEFVPRYTARGPLNLHVKFDPL